MPVAAEQPHVGSAGARHQAKAVVLDLVNPAGTARRMIGG